MDQDIPMLWAGGRLDIVVSTVLCIDPQVAAESKKQVVHAWAQTKTMYLWTFVVHPLRMICKLICIFP